MSAEVRPARAADLSAIMVLYRQLSPEDPALSELEEARAWRALLECPTTQVLVAESEGTLVATCTLTLVPNMTRAARPYGLIENVVTHSDHRRRGHGTAVVKAALEAAWAAKAYKVMLATGSTRESTHRFYEAAGLTKGEKTFFQARRGFPQRPPSADVSSVRHGSKADIAPER